MSIEHIIECCSSPLQRMSRFFRNTLYGSTAALVLGASALGCSDGQLRNFPPDMGQEEEVCTDNDKDNFYAQKNCGTEVDCDDVNSRVYPGAIEFCDYLDNNCDEQVDEGAKVRFWEDLDRDGSGGNKKFIEACTLPSEDPKKGVRYSADNDDCNDADPAIHPKVAELCDSIDNNCDGEADEGFNMGEACYDGIGSCRQPGIYVCTEDRLTSYCTAVASTKEAEICDGIDNDCDGSIDEGLTVPSRACTVNVGVCEGSGTEYRICLGPEGWSADYSGCTAAAGEPSPEVCDGLNNDCDASTDEDLTPLSRACTRGVGACAADGLEYQICLGAAGWSPDYSGCTAVAGEPSPEACDGLNNDCDALTDEDLTPLSRACTRGDGVCTSSGLEYSIACLGEAGWSPEYRGCDAVLGESSPEACDGLDNDCDASTDEDLTPLSRPCTRGVGVCAADGLEYQICLGAAGWSTDYSGCSAVEREPGPESCNSFDNNCDGAIDCGGIGLIAFTSTRDGNAEIYTIDMAGGNLRRITTHSSYDIAPDWSPDGLTIAFESGRDGNSEIYRINADGSGLTKILNNGSDDRYPDWSPDGTMLAFYSGPPWRIYTMNADGSAVTQLPTTGATYNYLPAWSPDGFQIAFTSESPPNSEVYVMNADGSGQVNRTNNSASDNYAAWSPDGSKIAFASNRDGNFEIYVMNSDGSSPLNRTNHPSADDYPCWYFDGTKIIFSSNRGGNQELYKMNEDGADLEQLTFSVIGDNYHPDTWP